MDHGLWQYLCKRLLLCLITLLVILFSCYLLMRLAPGNAAKSSVLDSSGGAGMVASDRASLEQSKVLEEKLHLDKPLIVGFGIWLAVLTVWRVVHLLPSEHIRLDERLRNELVRYSLLDFVSRIKYLACTTPFVHFDSSSIIAH